MLAFFGCCPSRPAVYAQHSLVPPRVQLSMSISEGIQSQIEGIVKSTQDAAQLQWPPLSPDEAELQTSLSESVEDSQAAITAAARQLFDPTNIDPVKIQATGNGLRRFLADPASTTTTGSSSEATVKAMHTAGDGLSAATIGSSGGAAEILLTTSLGAVSCYLAYAQRAPIGRALDELARRGLQSLYPPGTFDEPFATGSVTVDDDSGADDDAAERLVRSDSSFWRIAQRTQSQVGDGTNE